jgi:pimeloyl-ACP methyl ester carboxylesterase
MAEPITVVLVPGGWHGAWCFDSFLPYLHKLGFETVAITLPSSQATPGNTITLEDDCQILRNAVESAGGKVVVACHSYGGVVTAQALNGLEGKVKALVYMCAFMPEEGEGLKDTTPPLKHAAIEVCESPPTYRMRVLTAPKGDVLRMKDPRAEFYEAFPPEVAEYFLANISETHAIRLAHSCSTPCFHRSRGGLARWERR